MATEGSRLEPFRIVWVRKDDDSQRVHTACAGLFRCQSSGLIYKLTAMPSAEYLPLAGSSIPVWGPLHLVEIVEQQAKASFSSAWVSVADTSDLKRISSGSICNVIVGEGESIMGAISSTAGQVRIYGLPTDGMLYLSLRDRDDWRKLMCGAAVVTEDGILVAVIAGRKRVKTLAEGRIIDLIVASPLRRLHAYEPILSFPHKDERRRSEDLQLGLPRFDEYNRVVLPYVKNFMDADPVSTFS